MRTFMAVLVAMVIACTFGCGLNEKVALKPATTDQDIGGIHNRVLAAYKAEGNAPSCFDELVYQTCVIFARDQGLPLDSVLVVGRKYAAAAKEMHRLGICLTDPDPFVGFIAQWSDTLVNERALQQMAELGADLSAAAHDSVGISEVIDKWTQRKDINAPRAACEVLRASAEYWGAANKNVDVATCVADVAGAALGIFLVGGPWGAALGGPIGSLAFDCVGGLDWHVAWDWYVRNWDGPPGGWYKAAPDGRSGAK